MTRPRNPTSITSLAPRRARMPRLGLRGLLALAAVLPGAAVAQTAVDTGDFQLNTATTGDQQQPDVARLPSNGFVAAWVDDGNESVHARIYDASGTTVAGPFTVDDSAAGINRSLPRVDADAGGNFVVAWHEYDGSAGVPDLKHRRFNASGGSLSSQVTVAGSTGANTQLDVGVNAGGRFVVVWATYGGEVLGQRYNADGSANGGGFAVNTYTTGSQNRPSVAANPAPAPAAHADEFVVVWTSAGDPSGTDSSSDSVQLRRFDETTALDATELLANDVTTNSQTNAAVATADDGSFVVTWESNGASAGSDTTALSVQARLFQADGSPAGGQFQVNTFAASSQQVAAVAMDANGAFVITWFDGSDGLGGDDSAVYGRGYFADGSPLAGDFQVNTYTTNAQFQPAVAFLDDSGSFVVTWRSQGSDGGVPTGSSDAAPAPDTDGFSVIARRYGSALPVELIRFGLD